MIRASSLFIRGLGVGIGEAGGVDVVGCAVAVMKIATGQVEEETPDGREPRREIRTEKRSKHSRKRLGIGGGQTGKTAVVGLKDRHTYQVESKVVARTDKPTLQRFVLGRAAYGSDLYTDDAHAYRGLPNHTTVRHNVREYVNGMAHTNGVESHWALLKRGYRGTYHHMSRKHLHRHVSEFDGRHNRRSMDTLDQMASIARSAVGKRLTYRTLIR